MTRVAFILLLIQSTNALLAGLVQTAIGGFGALLLSALGVAVLTVVAGGVLRGKRWANRLAVVVEVLMLLGTVPRLVQAIVAQAGPEPVWFLTNLGLPIAIIASVRSTARAFRLPGLLVLTSGLLHLSLVGEHPGGLGLLFLIDGVLLLALATLLLRGSGARKPTAWLIAANLVAYLVVVGSAREGVDSIGLATKLLELVALGLLVLPETGRRRRWAMVSGGLVVTVFLTGAVTWASEARAGKVGAHVHVAASAPPPTYTERVAAQDLVAATRIGIAPYEDEAAARRAGYEPSGPKTAAQHYVNARFQHDGRVLDPQRPEGLVYIGSTLAGAMYEMPKVGETGPSPGGTLTHWHSHENVCIGLAGLGLSTPFGTCPVLSIAVALPAMLHVWTIDNPSGPFADHLDDAFVKRLAQQVP